MYKSMGTRQTHEANVPHDEGASSVLGTREQISQSPSFFEPVKGLIEVFLKANPKVEMSSKNFERAMKIGVDKALLTLSNYKVQAYHCRKEWDEGETRQTAYSARIDLAINDGLIDVLLIGEDYKRYNCLKEALQFTPTLDNFSKYARLRYSGVVPSVFHKDAKKNLDGIPPSILTEENATFNRLFSLIKRDVDAMILTSAFILSHSLRERILLYICDKIDKPSLITSLTYLYPQAGLDKMIQDCKIKV